VKAETDDAGRRYRVVAVQYVCADPDCGHVLRPPTIKPEKNLDDHERNAWEKISAPT
jgi:hypothetical protein